MATFNDPYGIGTGIGQYYQGALAQDPRMAAINRNMSGQVAPDVRNQLAQAAAERGVGIGSYGSGNDQSALLRALGLTSMDLTNKGLGQYGEAYSQVPQLKPGELFVNPTDEANMATQQRLQTERLNSAAGLQAGQIASTERMAAAARSQAASNFEANRSDTKSGASATDAKLNGILERLSGGGGRLGMAPSPGGGGSGGGGYNPNLSSDTSFASVADPSNLWWQPSDYEFGYTGPSSAPATSFSNAWEPSAQDWSNFDNLDYYGGY